ncbi:hypothetical protein NHX12_010125 [Muraenolepis orangiensis]|uniref:HSF-type DNA-binding domain-containing protein n=1 Tax=Muraenolepis orangiensis TaxID=630683 RepID=A0A9Q0DLM3_9TELE|nr:hypothetical protein NHX12_010125 [Muraenolepis orangiensis]
MDVHEALVDLPINRHSFPGKLWRLVNLPGSGAVYGTVHRAVRWDPSGRGLVIRQQLFEKRFLTGGSGGLFRTTQFSSVIRQLNLYGFKKVLSPRPTGRGGGAPGPASEEEEKEEDEDDEEEEEEEEESGGLEHHFLNPYFRRGRPELLVNLRRPTKRLRNGKIEDKVEKRGSSCLGQTQQPAQVYPYSPSCPPPMKEYSGTPIPLPTWMMDEGSKPYLPLSVLHGCPGESSSPATVHTQQAVHRPEDPGQNYYNLTTQMPQYQPACYTLAYECPVPPSSVSSSVTGTGTQASPASHLGYYQNQDVQSCEDQDLKKIDFNWDAVMPFIMDEFQPSAEVGSVRVVTPEKPAPPSTDLQDSTLPHSAGSSSVEGAPGSPLEEPPPVLRSGLELEPERAVKVGAQIIVTLTRHELPGEPIILEGWFVGGSAGNAKGRLMQMLPFATIDKELQSLSTVKKVLALVTVKKRNLDLKMTSK